MVNCSSFCYQMVCCSDCLLRARQSEGILWRKTEWKPSISMPSGVFKPYAGVSTAILTFTRTGHGGTDNVWFYDMKADGLSLDISGRK